MTDLLIVARNQPGLYVYLREDFSTDGNVEVILDRRFGERRRARASIDADRRRRDRRARPDLRDKLVEIGFAVVRVDL